MKDLMTGDILTGKPDIDLVFIDNTGGRSIIESFDFTNSCAAFGQDGLIENSTFMSDILSKTLRINKLKLPFHSIQRAGKFVKEGYSIDMETKLMLLDSALNASRTLEQEKEYQENL